jgi:hypothetical protein
MHKYKNSAPAGGYGFTPLIIETSWTLGRSLKNIIERNIEKAADNKKNTENNIMAILDLSFKRSLSTFSSISDITKYIKKSRKVK